MKRKKILIVEDEPAILKALAATFKREGLEVHTAEDGEKGLATALHVHPDIILLDIIMPNLDGLAMLARIRTEGGDWGMGAKAIVYTNLSYNERREEARRAGVSDFLVKANTRIEEVLHKVKEELRLTPPQPLEDW